MVKLLYSHCKICEKKGLCKCPRCESRLQSNIHVNKFI